jgi:hypothetical protein
LDSIVALIEGHDPREVALITSAREDVPLLRQRRRHGILVGFAAAPGESPSAVLDDPNVAGVDLVFCDADVVDGPIPGVRVIARFALGEDIPAYGPWFAAETSDVLLAADTLRGCRLYFADDFSGSQLDGSTWMSGISGGFETPTRTLFDAETRRRLVGDSRAIFDTRLRQQDGLVIDIRPGYQYASAGIVSRFPIGGDAWVEVDWEFGNPERATMMLLGFVNTDAFSSHRPPYGPEGEVVEPRWDREHQLFDTHGNPPFVSIEREENDGIRIMCNRSDSNLYRWYNNFYQPNVGNGLATRGSMRLQRRGRYFCAYYKDEANLRWTGVGALENVSINERAYVRMGAKHYPKENAPDPLPANLAVFRHLRIFRRDRDLD